MDHYVIGSESLVRGKMLVRSQVAQVPCVLVAHPVTLDDAAMLNSHAASCFMNGDSDAMKGIQYSWQDYEQNGYLQSDYYSKAVSIILDTCPVVPPGSTHPLVPLSPVTALSGTIILSPPGGGTTWFFSALLSTLTDPDLVARADLFHPYVSDKYRTELTYVFAAAEDASRLKLMREECVNCDLLPSLVSLLTDGKPFITKEVINIFRSLDLADDYGIDILLLFRARGHTFPTVGDDTCRMCFFSAFHESLQAQTFTIPWLHEAQRFIRPFNAESVEAAVLIHTVLWRYILYRIPKEGTKIVRFDEMITSHSPAALLRERWAIAELFDVKGLDAIVLGTRRSPQWLVDRTAAYVTLGTEHLVQGLLDVIRQADPLTEDSILTNYA